MKTYLRNATDRRKRRTAACLLPLLVLLAGCDRITDPLSGGEDAALDGANVTITFTAEEGTAGLFFSASGAIQDAGRVEGDLLRVDLADELPDTWSGLRGLRGAHGVLALAFEGERATQEEGPRWTGRFTILDNGTGAYAGLRGSGLFMVRLDEDGRPIETFTGTVSR